MGPLLTGNLATNSKALKLGQHLQQQQLTYEGAVGAEGAGSASVQQQHKAGAATDVCGKEPAVLAAPADACSKKTAAVLGPVACNKETGAVLGPELVGFVLLDPLWEEGQEVGYVASVMRMKRSAHTGERGTAGAAVSELSILHTL